MARTFTQLTLSERLDFLYKLLKKIEEEEGERTSTREIRDQFTSEHDLTEYTGRKMVDLLEFSRMVRLRYTKEFPTFPYYGLTPYGMQIVGKGYLVIEDIPEFPGWLRKTILRGVRKVIPAFVRIRVKKFVYWIPEDWDYKVYVETPLDWLEPWQVDSPWRDGPTIPADAYSVKHRAITTARINLTGVPDDFPGQRKVYLTEEALNRRKAMDRKIPKDKRTTVIDPRNRVGVRQIGTVDGKRRWIVDFSPVADTFDLPPKIDTVDVADTFSDKYGMKRNYSARTTSSLWS